MNNELLDNWLSLTHIQMKINNALEAVFQEKYDLTLKEFYVLYYLSLAYNKRLRLQDLPDLVGLSQSAVSRLVTRLEARSCQTLQRSACEDDLRGVYTSLTTKGEEAVKECIETFNQVFLDASSENSNKQELLKLINKL
ncbi:MarR family transcriptional regulator [Peribacillus frigoritolerans]|uniref:MarR family winged helix-turn-helix transcriptional regulator n=1 Tax=Peribacillus TaxID=2675229 RepID=UPI002161C8E8|nr:MULTISPECIES: MarR family transcriptional regulator [Peribacillus]MBX9956154.1 MarR family transcriptional regulator [Peribacillus simplex]